MCSLARALADQRLLRATAAAAINERILVLAREGLSLGVIRNRLRVGEDRIRGACRAAGVALTSGVARSL